MAKEKQQPNVQETPPTLEQMESAKSALLTFVMYYYQALRQHGHPVDEAKEIVAQEILSLYERYAKLGNITFRPHIIRNPMKLLDEIMEEAKALGIQGKPLLNKLIEFKSLIDEGGNQSGTTTTKRG